MRLRRAVIENFRAITRLELDLHPQMNVFFGGNGKGKTSVLRAIAVGLGSIPRLLPRVATIGFRWTDRRGERPIRIELEADDGTRWERRVGLPPLRGRLDALRERLGPIAAGAGKGDGNLPILAFYGTDRAVADQPQRRGPPRAFSRLEALDGALSARTNFQGLFSWFYGKEHEESSEQKRRRDPDYRLPELEAVRRGLASLVPGVTDPMVAYRPLRFSVSLTSEDGQHEDLAIDQLSGGYRVMLALAADLARRMAQGNPHLDDPLESEAIVLIDEVELHLHPSWQQAVLPDLMRTFPNAQFLVTTHSPQVLTTVEANCVFDMEREDGNIVVGGISVDTFGAEAGDILEGVMRVRARPDNDFVRKLDAYLELVDDGDGETEEAKELRRRLEAISPRDPGLTRADSEIRRQRVLHRLGRTP